MVDDPLSGWGLRPVELTDRSVLEPYFASLSHPLSDYTFSQLFTWRNSLRIAWRVLEGHLCVFANGTGDLTLLMPPIGDSRGDRALDAAFELMDDYNASHGVPNRSRVEYVSDELLPRFGPQNLLVEPQGTDYLYDVNRMIDLAGGDFSSKRQAKNRFMRNYEHQIETYAADRHMAECLDLLNLWREHQDASDAANADAANSHLKRQKELAAVELSLRKSDELGLKGMIVRVKDGDAFKLKGFTFGETLGRDQSSITIEKTDLEVKGLAQFIFSEFCRTHWADRPLVNAGDDWGLESLAWTKNSYRPVRLLKKHTLRRAVIAQVSVPVDMIPTAIPVGAELVAEDLFAQIENAPAAIPMPAMQGTDPMPVRIRPAGKADVAAALELEQACFDPSVSLKQRQLQYLQQRQTAVFFVAEQVDTLIGSAIALIRRHKTGLSGRIYSLAVRSEFRGQKIGRKLLTELLQALSEKQVGRVFLEVDRTNTGAIKLYESLGFSTIGTLAGYYAPGVDAVHMMAELEVTAGKAAPAA